METVNIVYPCVGGILAIAYMISGAMSINRFKNLGFVPMTMFSVLSLIISCIWIWFLSNFVVDTLTLIGFITELPSGYLGLTLLAIGNCVGDFIADVSIAGKNLVDMAITGTYSSPTFNLMLGLGSAIIINCLKSDGMGFIPFKFGRSESYVAFWATALLIGYNFIFLGTTIVNK